MDTVRIGKSLRALRHRRRWTQRRLASASGVSRGSLSRLETGEVSSLSIVRLEAVANALGARIEVSVRWNGEQLDRLMDEAHATLIDWVVRLLTDCGWEVAVEISFNVDGERGSIDVLAFHWASAALVVVEVKSVVPDLQSTLMILDRKARLASRVASAKGWRPANVSRLLVIGRSATAYRRLAAHAPTLAVALPLRGVAVRRWLREPTGAVAGLLVVPSARLACRSDGIRQRERVRPSSRARILGRPRSGPAHAAPGRRADRSIRHTTTADETKCVGGAGNHLRPIAATVAPAIRMRS